MNMFPGGQKWKDKIKLAVSDAGYGISDDAQKPTVLWLNNELVNIDVRTKSTAFLRLGSIEHKCTSASQVVGIIPHFLRLAQRLHVSRGLPEKEAQLETVKHYLGAVEEMIEYPPTLLSFKPNHKDVFVQDLYVYGIDDPIGRIEFRMFMNDTKAAEKPIVVYIGGKQCTCDSFDKFMSAFRDDGKYWTRTDAQVADHVQVLSHQAAFFPKDVELVAPWLLRQGFNVFKSQLVKTVTRPVLGTRELSPISYLIADEGEVTVIVASKK